jgi:hypothetical protein
MIRPDNTYMLQVDWQEDGRRFRQYIHLFDVIHNGLTEIVVRKSLPREMVISHIPEDAVFTLVTTGEPPRRPHVGKIKKRKPKDGTLRNFDERWINKGCWGS